MNCRELKPEETIARGDYFQTKFGGDRLFCAACSVTMTVAAAIAKWRHITAFYRPVEPTQKKEP